LLERAITLTSFGEFLYVHVAIILTSL
jgi:hypothetical protein